MARDRANLKISPDQLARFNRLRKTHPQGAFFKKLMDEYEREEPGRERIESGDSEQLDRIEEIVRNVPGRTADEVEGRMSRR